ncbi:hypothetical protein BaRGS_00014032 [Batillaria attramentaria]|uniref:Uncharacterized protein n=1 Tax=Batillaria attramentaria TaxID=370345 RepID=A0ABD0L6G4_9CAEN
MGSVQEAEEMLAVSEKVRVFTVPGLSRSEAFLQRQPTRGTSTPLCAGVNGGVRAPKMGSLRLEKETQGPLAGRGDFDYTDKTRREENEQRAVTVVAQVETMVSASELSEDDAHSDSLIARDLVNQQPKGRASSSLYLMCS